MRTYLIFKEKAKRWNEHPEIRQILDEIAATDSSDGYSEELLSRQFDRVGLASKGLKYEKLDQLTMDILLGVD